MRRGLGYFFLIVTFIMGISIGLYTGTQMNNTKNIAKNSRVEDSMQDIVLQKVQSGSFWDEEDKEFADKSGNKEDIVITVSLNEEKISPYAKMIIKKTFSRCEHSNVNIIDVPKEIINYTKSELEEKYTGWKIEKFSSDEVILYREIDAKCDDHFVLKEKEGNIAVYNELTEDKMNLIELLDVDIELLSEEDKNKLEKGIKVYGKDELSSLIEDYNS